MTTLAPHLDENALYIGDNGRIFCGGQRCSGITAHYTGRDISGQKVQRLGDEDLAWMAAEIGREVSCESCGKEITP